MADNGNARLKLGMLLPHAERRYGGETARWSDLLALAQLAEDAGFDSLWTIDHWTVDYPGQEPQGVWECWSILAALAATTSLVELGPLVTPTSFRNPALLAKMVTTMDVISNGRMILGIGAGWKEEEWRAYGWGFPSLRARQRHLEDSLEVITRMLHEPGRASWSGETALVEGAINEPKPVQSHLPILVGGNGRKVTWRIAARLADELNVDNMSAEEWTSARADLEQRCEEVRRDPATIRVSVHIWWETLDAAPSRPELLRAYADAGVDRVMTLVRAAAHDVDELDRFADDCRAAGLDLDAPS